MNIEAPTFNALNKPQKRALILRDQLRFLDPHHLESFLDGISENEPPIYTKLNGAIMPELALVTVKEEAAYFDLGNVQFSENNNAVHRVYLVSENGQIQMRMEDPLPLDDDVLDSLPIHGFIAKGMMPLFKEKFHAIQSRMNKINEARRAAYKTADKTLMSFHEEEACTLTRSNPPKNKVPTASPSKHPVEHKSSQKVKQHISNSISEDAKNTTLDVQPRNSNKRKRAALDTVLEDTESKTIDTIPRDANSRILDAIPNSTKISLFNTMVQTAFPHLDNLINASRNLVGIYSTSGSDLSALHNSVDALKHVLQDIDETIGEPVDRETPRYRHNFEVSSRSGEAENHCVSTKHDSAGGIYHTTSTGHPVSRPKSTFKTNTTIPSRLSTTPPPPHTHSPLPQPPSPPSNQPSEYSVSFSPSDSSSSPDSIPYRNPHPPPSTSTSNTPQHISPSILRTSDLHTTYTSITALHRESVQRFQTNNATDIRRRTSSPSGIQTSFLGNSLLGPRKHASMGTAGAPVVNMVPVVRQKEEDQNGNRKGERAGGDADITGMDI